MRYITLVVAVVFAAAAVTGCLAKRGYPGAKPSVAKCVTLEITLTQEVQSQEGGGALETKELMKVVQRITVGTEFESRDEKKKDYKEMESGVEVDVTGKEVFSVSGNSKTLDTDNFLLMVELQYVDEEAKVNFDAKPSAIIAYDSTDEVVLTESGAFKITLKVSQPESVDYTK
jgi:hypothetical protein